MCSTQSKRRDFCFILKDYTQEEYDLLLDMQCRYLILGKEIDHDDDHGKRKIQGYIYFHCPRTFQVLKKISLRIEMDELLGTPKLNYEYCSKQNNFEERGELPNHKRIVQLVKPIKMEKSFATHEKSKFWSSLNTLKPEEVSLNSHKNFWFDCSKCGHVYESILNNITTNDSGCPYCYNRKLCGKKECTICFEKSFASNEKSEFWSSKNELLPLQVSKGTFKKYFFDCTKCGHELFKNLKGITDNNRWCCYCSHQELCENDNCNFCFKHSFSSIEYSKYWNQTMNMNITPRKTFKTTNKKFWFDCNICKNSFEKTISSITLQHSWCPICKNKTERKLLGKFNDKYYDVEREYKFSWCKNIKELPFDFVLLHEKIIIELDGPHHFRQVSNWGKFEDNQKRDLYKMKCANENGFSVIRILQQDVLYDKYDWFTELADNIDKIYQEKRIQNIYMCLKDEYKDFVIEN